jgi:hypothetical protein
MRYLIALIFLVCNIALADEARNSNPGEDVNEAKNTKATEADVAATGICRECISRMKHGRLGDDTAYRKTQSSSATGASGKTNEGSQ